MPILATLRERPEWIAKQDNPRIVAGREALKKESQRLDFDPDTHTYTDRLTGECPVCVSDIVESFAMFDAEKKARELSARDYCRPGSKYYTMSPDNILVAWQEKADAAAAKGTLLHSYAEACFCVSLGRPSEAERQWWRLISQDGKSIAAETPEQAAVIAAFNWMPDSLVPVAKESRLYKSDLGYAGTMDLLMYDILADYEVLLDWKTNEKLDKGHFDHMKAPFGFLWDTSLNHYKVQQSSYQLRLEELGRRIGRRYLLHISPAGVFTPVPIEEYMNTLKRVLTERKNHGLRADGSPK